MTERKIPKISWAIGIVGFVAITVSIIQWFFRFPDPSQFVLGVGVGACFIGFSYLYHWMHNKDEEDRERDEAIDRTLDFARTELEKIHEYIGKIHKYIKRKCP